MTAVRTLFALSVATFVAACAIPGTTSTAPTPPAMAHEGAHMPMAGMESRMKAMQEMHQKMMNAKTPEERQALMADHMKAMQDGMAMMKEMHGMHGAGGMHGMGGMSHFGPAGEKAPTSGKGGMAHGQGMPGGMAQRHQMMTDHMAMMQMMMDMMAQRMPPVPAAK
jgi:HPt (histidine-containing phosphotransfer) domain-containing protein